MKKIRAAAKPLTRERLEDIALRYAGRYAATRAMLERVLLNHLRRAMRRSQPPDPDKAKKWIEDIAGNAARKGWVNDRGYAEILIRSGRQSGWSKHKIAQKLAARGIDKALARALLGDRDGDEDELEAARALAKRKGLGPFRKNGKPAGARKELARLCRAGFTPEVARRALRLTSAQLEDAGDELRIR